MTRTRAGLTLATAAFAGAWFSGCDKDDFKPWFLYTATGGTAPLEVSFKAVGPETAQFEWDFGDGSPAATGPAAQHVFERQGSFPVRMITHLAGRPDSLATAVIAVEAPGLTVTVDSTASAVESGASVTFTAHVNGGTAPYRMTWSASGLVINGDTAQLTFDEVGPASILFTAVDAHGVTGSVEAQVEVVRPLAAFAGSADAEVLPVQRVSFGSLVTGGLPPYRVAWDFGDGAASAEDRPAHLYPAAGEYAARLTVTDARGVSVDAGFPVVVRPATYTMQVRVAAAGRAPDSVAMDLSELGAAAPIPMAPAGGHYDSIFPFAPQPSVRILIDAGPYGEEVLELSTGLNQG